jgi:hypothetical protein
LWIMSAALERSRATPRKVETGMATEMGLVEHTDEPALVRRQLGRHLRRLRIAAGKTHGDAETAGMGHRSTMWRIETDRGGSRRIGPGYARPRSVPCAGCTVRTPRRATPSARWLSGPSSRAGSQCTRSRSLMRWLLQRREDKGENVATIPVPPKYTSVDFRRQPWPSSSSPVHPAVPRSRELYLCSCEVSCGRHAFW